MSELVLGIDLGTTTTIVSVVRDGIPEVLPVEDKKNLFLLPSVVHFKDNGEVIVGTDAKKMRISSPESTVFSIKRVIGRKFSHPDTAIASLRFPYRIKEGANDSVSVEINGKNYSPQDISALVLKQAKEYAEKRLGCVIKKAVITVPANFNDAQRRATQNAGRLAGLEVLRIVNEPTAAALAYGFGSDVSERIAVYDFGGGTFDITVLEVKNKLLEVLSTDGNSFLGGDDLDNMLLEFFVDDIEKKYKIKILNHPEILNTLASETERIKMTLTDREKILVIIKGLIPQGGRMVDYSIDIERDFFESMIKPVIDRTFRITDNALKNAHLKPSEIDQIVLVGGSTKVPLVQKMVFDYFQKHPCLGIHSELVVSMGAAILANSLEVEFKEDTPVLLDVTPLAIGVGTVGDYIEILVDKNDPLPTERSSVFTNAVDGQQTVRVAIFQGDSNKKSQSLFMGEVILSNLRPAKRGELKIEVKFELDTNGVLNVSAVDLGTGRNQKIELNILGLGEQDVEVLQILNEIEKA